jgi:four helix bundle protein
MLDRRASAGILLPSRKIRAVAQSHRDLIVWQRSMELAVECHALTRGFPRRNSSGLIGQIERAASSVPATIAEGNGRLTRADYLRYLSMVNGSLAELETHLMLAARLTFISPADLTRVLAILREVGRLLGGLIQTARLVEGPRWLILAPGSGPRLWSLQRGPGFDARRPDEGPDNRDQRRGPGNF